MIIIEDKLISDELRDKEFVCNLKVCKGACCIEGDGGAPLEKSELETISNLIAKVKPYLSDEGIKNIDEFGPYIYDESEDEYSTTLVNGKACVFVNYENGTSFCGIEKAYNENIVEFKKPISCHLYPIRVTKNSGFEALNYEKWDICNAACTLGEKLKVPVYQFLKEPIIRKYGEAFYASMEFAFNKKE